MQFVNCDFVVLLCTSAAGLCILGDGFFLCGSSRGFFHLSFLFPVKRFFFSIWQVFTSLESRLRTDNICIARGIIDEKGPHCYAVDRSTKTAIDTL